MNELVSEFFYEGIRRIIPGFLVISFYFHKEIVAAFSAHHDFFLIMLNAGVLLIAWLVGFTLERLMAVGIAFGWKCGGECSLQRIRGWLPEVHVQESEPLSKTEKREKRRQGYLYFAEKTMCRSLWLIFFVFCFWPPEPFSNIPLPKHFGIVGLIFLLCWLWLVVTDPQLQIKEKDKGKTAVI